MFPYGTFIVREPFYVVVLVTSVMAYNYYSHPRSDISKKMKYEKPFFDDFLSADFWQKHGEVIKYS